MDVPKNAAKPHRRFWKKKRWWLLLLLVSGLVWLDGPGWRWIAHRAAGHYLPGLGYDVDFELDGRLTSGKISVSDLRLTGETTVQNARLDRLEITYRLSRVVRGEVESIELDGLHAEVDLDAPKTVEDEEEPSEPVDPAELLAELRQRLVPMDLRLRDVSAVIRRGDELVFSMEPTSILHDAGSDAFRLDLGAMTLPEERSLSAQTTRIDWKPDRLVLDRLKLLEEVAIASLEAEIGETFHFQTELEIADDRFELSTDLEQADVQLVEGALTTDEVRRVAQIELPLDATVRELDIHVANLRGGLESITATATLGVDRLDYDDWTAGNLVLKAALGDDGTATATLSGTAVGSPMTLEAEALLDRANAFLPERAKATLSLSDARPALTHVRDRYTPSDEAPPLPGTSLELTATTVFTDGRPDDASATLTLDGGQDAPPLSLDAGWKEGRTATAELELPGATLDATFDTEELLYSGEASLARFAPDSLLPWLAPFGIGVPAGITASLDWNGRGDLNAATHQGRLTISEASWYRAEDQPPLIATASGNYDWPKSVELDSLKVRHDEQTLETRLELADRLLSLSKLSWSDGDEVLATGTAEIPVPEDLADWKALLRETRPISVDLETPELPLAKLHPFLPETVRFPEASRAQLQIELTGTPAAPELVAKVRANSLGLLDQPDIPSADLILDAVGKDQTLKIEGEILTANYPPAMIDLVTNWDPKQWAEDPETVKTAKLDADLSIANLNLASLATFVPVARTLEGRLNVEARVGGTVGEPQPSATITLDGGRFAMEDAPIPPIGAGQATINVTPESIEIENVSAEIAGGTLKLTGTLGLDEWKPGTLDLKLDADSIPALRNESMIVRLSADLGLTGPWERARLAGQVFVVDSLFFKDIELLPIGEPMTTVAEPSLPAIDAPAPKQVTSSIPEPFVNWDLAIDLKTKSPFLIRGNLASGEIYLDARIDGTIGSPRPSGGAKLREIVAELPFSTLEIKSGEVKLRPDHPFDPVLDLRGTSRIRPYDITVYVYGPVSDPEIQPTASPPLPETEVMTLIATGTTTEGLEDPSAAAARATQLLIEEARRGRIGAVKVLRPVFSVLDKIDFQVGEADAYTSKRYNSFSFNLDDNWVLSTGISEEGNTRSKVTYLFRFR